MVSEALPQSVHIREVGPREGFQIHPHFVETERKLSLIQALVSAGMREVEVTAFVKADRVPNMADADAVVAALPESAGVSYSALYLNVKGFQRAEATGKLRNKGWLYTSPSETFLRSNSNTSIEDSLKAVPEWCAEFRKVGKRVYGLMVSTAFGCGFEGEVKADAVARLVERYLAALQKSGEALSEICLADTVGLGHPNSVRECIRTLRPFGVAVSLHLHNTWGLGLANVYAGLCEGVDTFETSVGGLGGCPFTPGAAGNVASEDVVYLCHALRISTLVDLNKLCAAAELAESILGSSLSSGVYRAWRSSGRCVK